MPIESAPFYWLVCDIDGCDARCPDPGIDEFRALVAVDDVTDYAEDADWQHNGHGLWACERHRNRWCEFCGADAGDLAGERDYLCEPCADREAADAR